MADDGRESCRLPNLLLGGAPKTGSTALFFHLARSTQIYVGATKELHYHARLPQWNASELNRYTTNYSGWKNEAYAIDASTSYLGNSRKVLNSLEAHQIAPKIIFVLRDPVDRLISHYNYAVKLGRESRPLEQVISDDFRVDDDPWGDRRPYMERSIYSRHLQRYSDAGIDFLTLDHAELREDPERTLAAIGKFLSCTIPFGGIVEHRNESVVARGTFGKVLLGVAQRTGLINFPAPASVRRYVKPLLFQPSPVPPEEVVRELRVCLNAEYVSLASDIGLNFSRGWRW